VTTAARSVGQFVPGYGAYQWTGVGEPKNTPVEIIDKLNREINAWLADELIAAETEKRGKVVRAANIKEE
jgi:tripartite-type tricarboxylate transporter receptor subunit TctC